MNVHSNIMGGLAQELVQLDNDLQAAITFAASFDAHRKSSETAFKDAVSEVYDAWAPRMQRFDLLRAFCAAKGIQWSEKKYLKNQFLPIIQHLFDIEPTDQSTVSYALLYAIVDKVPTGGFKAWIDDKKIGGYSGAYAKYRKHLAAQTAQAAAGAQAPWLRSLYDAARLMRELTRSATIVSGEIRHPRQFLLRNAYNKQGEFAGVLELVSTAYTFTAARMSFSQPIAEIGARAYLFSDDAMSEFVALFPTTSNWTAAGQVDEVLISADSGLTIRGDALSAMYDGLPLRALATFRSRTDTVHAQLAKMQSFEGWLQEGKSLARRQHAALTQYWPGASKWQLDQLDPLMMRARVRERMPAYKMPRALDFDGTAIGFMSAYVPNGSAFRTRVHDLFVIPPTHTFETGVDCQLHIKHARRLCEVFSAERIQPYCSVAHAHEAESAFVCEASISGGRFLVAYPTVMNPKGELRCLAEDLDMAALMTSGITAPDLQSQPQTASSRAATSLMMSASKEVAERFAAYIISCRLDDEDEWQARRAVFLEQLKWWEANTAMPLHLRLVGWDPADVDAFNADSGQLLDLIEDYGGSYKPEPAGSLAEAHLGCLGAFYETDVDWGVIMHDDVVLDDYGEWGSGPGLFSEMALNGSAAYQGVDVFFPMSSADGGDALMGDKDLPGTGGAQVFEPSGEVQAGLFVVRNFRKSGRGPLLPPIGHHASLNDADMLFAVEALDRGYAVMRCQNIRLSKNGSCERSDTSDHDGPAGAESNERVDEPSLRHDPATKPARRSFDLGQLYAARLDGKEAPVRVAKPE